MNALPAPVMPTEPTPQADVAPTSTEASAQSAQRPPTAGAARTSGAPDERGSATALSQQSEQEGLPQVADEAAIEPAKARAPFKGFVIGSDDGDYSLKLGGLVQADGRFFLGGDGTDTFVARRARIDLRATLGKYFSLRLHPELAGSSITLLDAYATVAFVDEIELQVGKMKSPIGLELLQSPRDMPFPERGLPSLLVPNRDVGAVLQGELFDGVVAYAAGVFNGVPDGANGDADETDEKDLEGRVFLRPLVPTGVDALAGLGVGVGASVGDQAGALPAYRTPGRQTFFAYADTSTAAGSRARLSPQGYYYYGPIGLLGEYVRSTQDVSIGANTTELTSSAWQVLGSVVLGGKAGYKGVKVKAPLDPVAGTWGALELALRYGELHVDQDAFDDGFSDPTASARVAKNLGAAVSWWFLNGSRALVAFDRTSFTGGGSAGNRETESVLIARLQVAL